MTDGFEDAIPFARQLIAAAPEHMVWGTDWPHPAMFDFMPDDGRLLDALFTYCDDHTATRILVDNPATLYGFGADKEAAAGHARAPAPNAATPSPETH